MLTREEANECLSVLRKKVDAINKTKVEIHNAIKKIWLERFSYIKSTKIPYKDHVFEFGDTLYTVRESNDRYELYLGSGGILSSVLDNLHGEVAPSLRFYVECCGRNFLADVHSYLRLETIVCCSDCESHINTRRGQSDLVVWFKIVEEIDGVLKRIIDHDLPAFDKFVSDKYVEAKKWERKNDLEIIKMFKIKDGSSNIKAKSYRIKLEEVDE